MAHPARADDAISSLGPMDVVLSESGSHRESSSDSQEIQAMSLHLSSSSASASPSLLTQNASFYQHLMTYQDAFQQSNKLQRPILVVQIINDWQQKNGRFLRQVSEQQWEILSDKRAREKLSKALKTLTAEEGKGEEADASTDKAHYAANNPQPEVAYRSIPIDPKQAGDAPIIPPRPSPRPEKQPHRISSSVRFQIRNSQKLYTRLNERKRLLEIYQKAIHPSSSQKVHKTHILYLSGEVGVGKTTFALSLKPTVLSEGGFFVHVKGADLVPEEQPFQVIKIFVQQILATLLASYQESKTNPTSVNVQTHLQLCTEIMDRIGDEFHTLVHIAPDFTEIAKIATAQKRKMADPGKLSQISASKQAAAEPLLDSSPLWQSQAISMPQHNVQKEVSNSKQVLHTMSARRFEVAFHKLLGIICSPEHPLVLLLEDMQLSDESRTAPKSSSLYGDFAPSMDVESELIKLASTISQGFFVVVTVELENEDQEIKTATDKLPGIKCDYLNLRGLSLDAVNDLLADTLSQSVPVVCSLGKILFDVTKGNPLFVIEILRTLQDDALIHLDTTTNKWKWDMQQIQQHKSLQVQRLEDVFSTRLKRLSIETREVALIAACLGASFRLDTLGLACGGSKDLECDILLLESVDIIAREQGEENPLLYFSQNLIYQLAYDIMTPEQRSQRHLEIGRTLWKAMRSEQELNQYVFIILGQCFMGTEFVNEMEDRIALSRLCLQASEKAVESNGFEISAIYAKRGIELLGPTKWRKNNTYDLCLSLHNHAIDSLYAAGKMDEVESLIPEVLDNARVLVDEHRARVMQIYTLATKRDIAAALDIGLKTLQQLGERSPRRPSKLQVLRMLLRTRWMLRKESDVTVQNLPTVEDRKVLSCQVIYNVIWLSAYYSDPFLAAWIACRMVQLTIQHGACVVSSVGFAMLGTIVVGGGTNLDEANRYAKIALSLAKRFGGETWLCRIAAALYGIIGIWSRPMAFCLQRVEYAYQTGLGSGDMEYAMLNASISIWNNIDRLPIVELEARIRSLTDRMNSLGQEKAAFNLRAIWQLCLNFLGKATTGDPTILTGEVLNEDEMFCFSTATSVGPQDFSMQVNTSLHRLVLSYHFSQFEKAASFTKLTRHVYTRFGTVAASLSRFYEALALLENMRVQRHRKHLRLAIEHLRAIRKWAKGCPENFMAKVCLIEAEYARVRGDQVEAKCKYYCSILHAKESGILWEHALANERAGKFFVEVDQPTEAREHLTKALELYEVWGGTAKIAHLRQEIEVCLAFR